MKKVIKLTGRLVMVQESRFRLTTPKGQVYLLSLPPSSSISELDLLDLFDSNILLTISYQGEADFETGIVTSMAAL